MAVIGKIRKHSWLLVVIIGVALAGFVLQDFWRKSGSGRGSSEFAQIGDEKISRVEFDNKVREMEDNMKSQLGKDQLTSAESFQIMIDTWNNMEREFIMLEQFTELGIALEHPDSPKASISPEELLDLMTGTFVSPVLSQIPDFTDQTTGQVDRQRVRQVLDRFDELTDDQKSWWKKVETAIKEERLNSKYNTLLAQSYYIPTAFAKRMYNEANRSAQYKMLGVKYQTIADSTITVTDDDYQKYYDEHSYQYKIDASVDIDYVIWDVVPSAEDKKKVDDEVAIIYKDFQEVKPDNIANFMRAKSSQMYDSTYKKQGELPVQVDSILFNSPVGTIVPPYIDTNTYFISRLVQTAMRPDSIKASHIMFMFKDAPGIDPRMGITRTKEQAKALADSVLNVLKGKPGDFGPLAVQMSEFQTAKSDSGDLSWMQDGDINMKFFFDSCLIMKPGEMRVILSNLGYHVLYMADKTKDEKKVKVATVTRSIIPLKKTYDSFYSKASEFAATSRDAEAFNRNVAAQGLNKRSAQSVPEMRYSLPGLDYSREIIRWAFGEKVEKGNVSHVFDAQGKYIVALVVEKRAKGIAPLEQVKTGIEPLVKREKKAETLMSKLNEAIAATKDLSALSIKLNTAVDTVVTLTMSTVNIPNFGPDPSIVGTIFTLKPNTLSAPLKGDMACYLVQVDGFLEPPANEDFTMMRYQYTSFFYQRMQNGVYQALKDKTDIIDNRILYY